MAKVGTPDAVTLLGAAGIQPKHDALSRLPPVNFPLETSGDSYKPFNYGTIRWQMMTR